MAHYILQILFFQLSFLLVYELLLKKESFFNYNRWYLLLTPVVSLLLPFLELQSLNNLLPAETVIMLPEIFIGEKAATTELLTSSSGGTGIQRNWWLVLYSIGFLMSLVFLIRKFIILKSLFRGKIISEKRNYKIIEVPNSGMACTFLNTIFLGAELSGSEKQQILEHELVHVRQKHSIDLLYFELLKLIFWFNPLIYIFQNKIAALHEFIADAAVVKNIQKRDYYEQLLNSAFNTKNIPFINQFFNHSLTKKRIVMLQKSKSKTIAKLKYLLLVPLLLVMLTYVACSDDIPMQETIAEMNGQNDEVIKATLWKEITEMDKNGASFQRIGKIFVTEGDAPIKSKEAYYRMQTFMKFIYLKEVDREKTDPNYDPRNKNVFQSILDQDYEEYIVKRKDLLERAKTAVGTGGEANVPFAVIDEVPLFPGCEDLSTNSERKECMTQKLAEFVGNNFNKSGVESYAKPGINRINIQFKITTSGDIEIMGVRGPSPELEAEAKRVIEKLPKMLPGKHDGKEVGVLYGMPITFRIN